MLDRADEDRCNPRAPWNLPDAETKEFEVTVLLSREITQIVKAFDQDEALTIAETICEESDLNLNVEALSANEL